MGDNVKKYRVTFTKVETIVRTATVELEADSIEDAITSAGAERVEWQIDTTDERGSDEVEPDPYCEEV